MNFDLSIDLSISSPRTDQAQGNAGMGSATPAATKCPAESVQRFTAAMENEVLANQPLQQELEKALPLPQSPISAQQSVQPPLPSSTPTTQNIVQTEVSPLPVAPVISAPEQEVSSVFNTFQTQIIPPTSEIPIQQERSIPGATVSQPSVVGVVNSESVQAPVVILPEAPQVAMVAPEQVVNVSQNPLQTASVALSQPQIIPTETAQIPVQVVTAPVQPQNLAQATPAVSAQPQIVPAPGAVESTVISVQSPLPEKAAISPQITISSSSPALESQPVISAGIAITEQPVLPTQQPVTSPVQPEVAVPQNSIPVEGIAKQPVAPQAVPQTVGIEQPVAPQAVPQTGGIAQPVAHQAVPQTGNITQPVAPQAVPQTGNITQPVAPQAVPQTFATESAPIPQGGTPTVTSEQPVISREISTETPLPVSEKAKSGEVVLSASEKVDRKSVVGKAPLKKNAIEKTVPETPVVVPAQIPAEAILSGTVQTVAPQAAPISAVDFLSASANIAATSRTQELVAAVEAIADQLLVTPGLLRGEGEIRIHLKPEVLDGSAIQISARGNTISVQFAPANTNVEQFLQQNQVQLSHALSERIHNFQINVGIVPNRATKRQTIG